MSENFGDKLKRLRVLRNLTQEELRACLKQAYPDARISQTAISVWESRELQPNAGVLTMLSGFFGVANDYWFLGEIHTANDNRLEMATMRLSGLYREYKNDLPEYARDGLRELIGRLSMELLDGGDA